MEGGIPDTGATISPKALEDAVQNALKNYFPRLESTGSGPRAEFYSKFKREADEYDNDFLEKYRGDLDTTLIFAGLFSAVASAFIVAIQTRLQPDYTQLSYDILWMTANSTGLSPPAKPSSDSPWTGPDRALIHVQAILSSSLAASLLSAFFAMLGKQWLNRYSQVEMRGSLMDRSRDRQRKMDGMATWGFKFVMESLPLTLQGALLLFGCALSKYLFTVDNLIAWVVFGFTAFGSLFYLAIIVAASISYDCPFQTPLSLIIRFMVCLFIERGKYLERSRRWFLLTFSQKRWRRRRLPRGPYHFNGFGGPNENGHTQLNIVNPLRLPPIPFEKETDRGGFVLDSNCIAWMFEMSMDPDTILDIMKFIPEIIWHDGIVTTPLEKLYDTVIECFDRSSGSPVLIPKFRNKAYLSAKALLHLSIQRKCMGDESDVGVFESLSRRHRIIGPWGRWGDSDLDYTLGMVDCVFEVGGFDPTHWRGTPFTTHHLAWMAHILPYRAWYFLRNGDTLPDDISEFLRYSLRQDPLPPTPVMSGCVLVMCLVLGVRPDSDDHNQPVIEVDESQKLRSRISRMYLRLLEIFRSTNSTEIDRALEAMELITAISGEEVATSSYELFHVTIQRPVSPVYTQEKMWKATRLALQWAYKWDRVLPPVKDPQPILDFLSHHFELVGGDEVHDEPIQNALCALAYASTPETIEALKNFNPTRPSFVQGICHVFQEERPLQLRKAALFFLPLIADKWFNSPDAIMEKYEMERLCVEWASAVDEVWDADGVREAALAVLLDMINSPRWRPYVVPEKWKLLAHFDSIPDDSQPLARCLKNPDLVDAITTEGDPDDTVLWSKILSLKFDRLGPKVQERFEASGLRGAQRLHGYLRKVRARLVSAEADLAWHSIRYSKPASMDFVAMVENYKAVIKFLESG